MMGGEDIVSAAIDTVGQLIGKLIRADMRRRVLQQAQQHVHYNTERGNAESIVSTAQTFWDFIQEKEDNKHVPDV